MNVAGPAGKRPSGLAAVAERLHNPIHLRVLLTLGVLTVWYVGFYGPTSTEIDRTAARTARERKRVRLAREVEHLRVQVRTFQERLPEKTDANEWVQYFLAMAREYPIRLVMLDTDAPKDLGEFKAMVVRIDVEGKYRDVSEFLKRVESDRRLLRIDLIRIDPLREGEGNVSAKLVVLGVMG